MRFRNLSHSIPTSSMDMTPIIDIVFNLLLFFLLSSSYVQHSALQVTIPHASTSQAIEGEPVIVELTRTDHIYLQGQEVNLETLKTRLSELYKDPTKARPLLVRADAYAYHARVVALLDIAREMNVGSLNVETTPDPEEKGRDRKDGAR